MERAINNITGLAADKGPGFFSAGVSTKKMGFNFTPDTADLNEKVYAIGEIPAGAIILKVAYQNGAVTGGTDYDLGVYARQGLAEKAINADCLIDGADLSGASTAEVVVVPTAANYGKRLYELAGQDNGSAGTYTIAFTANVIGTTDDVPVSGYIEYIDNV